MRCVQPPLIAKPSRGYACASCSRRHEEEVDSYEIPHLLISSAANKAKFKAPAARGRGRPRKDRIQAKGRESSNKTFRYVAILILRVSLQRLLCSPRK